MSNELKRVQERLWKKSESVELAAEKIELGAIDDLDAKYKAAAGKVPSIKNGIESLASDLKSVVTELQNLQEDFKKLDEMAKFLGADSVQQRASTMVKTTGNLASAWGKIAISIQSQAKNI